MQVTLAEKLVAELLTPVDDDKNEHKQKQLRELVRAAFGFLCGNFDFSL